ncbi:MAG TPA: cysteine desulfurase family protein [Myxococcaceae bacterium]|nr:cysteine desulfurase family protein [Myxococcaceae bacterium]
MSASRIHFDHNATTPMRPGVRALLENALGRPMEGNPSSVHAEGRSMRRRLEQARERVARVLGAIPREVAFTASGTEGNALALMGAFLGAGPTRRRVVLSAIEHPSLQRAADTLAKLGAEVVRVAPGRNGRVDADAFLAQVDGTTAVASLMWANNETGVLQPVDRVARVCRERAVPFHTDAVQVAGRRPVRLHEVDAAMLTLSGHKFGGPPGSGVLVVRRNTPFHSVLGGHQEDGLRGGTQATWLAEGLALALEEAAQEALQGEVPAALAALRDDFEARVQRAFPDVLALGAGAGRLPHVSMLEFPGIDGEALLIGLDLAGISASSGAACASGTLAPSHVLLAMGHTPARAQSCLRFSLGPETDAAAVDRVVEALREQVPRARDAARGLA